MTLANLEDVVAKDSMLWSKAQFQSPNGHRRLKLLVAESVDPLNRILSIAGFVVGGPFVTIGLIHGFGEVNLLAPSSTAKTILPLLRSL